MSSTVDRDLLEAAVIGYQSKIAEMQQRIAQIRVRLDGQSPSANFLHDSTPVKPPKRTMSAAAKRKLSLIAKQRWTRLKRKQPNAKTLGG